MSDVEIEISEPEADVDVFANGIQRSDSQVRNGAPEFKSPIKEEFHWRIP